MRKYAELMIDASQRDRNSRAHRIQFLRRNGKTNADVRKLVGSACYALPFNRLSVQSIVRKAIAVRREARDSRICAGACVRQGMAEYFRQLSLSEREHSRELMLIARHKRSL